MAIIHALISKNNHIVLCEFTEYQGNFQQISRILLRRLNKEIKLTIDYNNYQFHYFKDENDIAFLCLTENLSYDIAFAFITDCRRIFYEMYKLQQIVNAFSYQLQEFDEIMKELFIYYSQKPSLTKFGLEVINLNIRNVEIRKADSIMEKIELYAINNMKDIRYQTNKRIEKSIYYQVYLKKFKVGIVILIVLVILSILIKYIV